MALTTSIPPYSMALTTSMKRISLAGQLHLSHVRRCTRHQIEFAEFPDSSPVAGQGVRREREGDERARGETFLMCSISGLRTLSLSKLSRYMAFSCSMALLIDQQAIVTRGYMTVTGNDISDTLPVCVFFVRATLRLSLISLSLGHASKCAKRKG
jgi:hypothetical protein